MDALRIGCNQPLPPLIEERDGEPAGFEPDLARLLCSRVGWRPQWSYRPFPDLPDLLDAGELDCIAGTNGLAGRIVGAVRGTTNLEQARRLAGAPEVRVYDPGMKVLGQLVEDVLGGVIDAALDDEVRSARSPREPRRRASEPRCPRGAATSSPSARTTRRAATHSTPRSRRSSPLASSRCSGTATSANRSPKT